MAKGKVPNPNKKRPVEVDPGRGIMFVVPKKSGQTKNFPDVRLIIKTPDGIQYKYAGWWAKYRSGDRSDRLDRYGRPYMILRYDDPGMHRAVPDRVRARLSSDQPEDQTEDTVEQKEIDTCEFPSNFGEVEKTE